MKISFDYNNKTQNVDRETTTYRASSFSRIEKSEAYQSDISGKVMDNAAYGGHGKTTEIIARQAEQMDVTLQKNYMAVMSNSMSGEDFGKMMEEGIDPSNTEIETVVTIVDKIKEAIAKGGTSVVGYTDTMDADTLEEMTGSRAFAEELQKQFSEKNVPLTKENVKAAKEAFDQYQELKEPTDGCMKYMIQNGMEPTIENFYVAGYSGATDGVKQGQGYFQVGTDQITSNYYVKKAETDDDSNLQSQLEKGIEQAGLNVTKERVQAANWLLNQGIPVDKDTLTSYEKISGAIFEEGMPQILNKMANAVLAGKTPVMADLSENESIYEMAAGYVEEIAGFTEETADYAASQNETITIESLRKANKYIQNKSEQKDSYNSNATVPENLHARRQLEEVRLQMTVEANIKLLKSDYSIDTTQLQQLVEDLKEAENSITNTVYGSTEAKSIYDETIATVQEIPNLPVAVIGNVASGEIPFNLRGIKESGESRKAAYEKAEESYETMMTAPRKDFGDSIKKAFRNVDDILVDLGANTSEENRRAVRILGYNQMEINEENLNKVKSVAKSVDNVIQKMTPGAVLQMIREGVNPLEENIAQMDDYLTEKKMETQTDAGNYSSYLYQLEQNKEITQEERDSYIGIYRLVRQLEKTDSAAIGNLIQTGEEVSLKNLLKEMRSTKKHGMDYKVNDQFGSVVSTSVESRDIEKQIQKAYENSIITNLNSDSISQVAKDLQELEGTATEKSSLLDMSLEEFQEALETAAKASQRKSEKQQVEFTYKAAKETIAQASDDVLEAMIEFDQPVTVENMAAANVLMNQRGKTFGTYLEMTKFSETSKQKLFDAMTDKESFQETYDTYMEDAKQQVEQEIWQENKSSIDVREMHSLYKQISLAANLAKEENYEVPMQLGDELTSVNVKIRHEKAESGKLSITLESKMFGKLAANFSVEEKQISGMLVAEKETDFPVERLCEEASKQMETGLSIKTSIYYEKQDQINFTKLGKADKVTTQKADNSSREIQSTVSTKTIYQAAKIFLTSISLNAGNTEMEKK